MKKSAPIYLIIGTIFLAGCTGINGEDVQGRMTILEEDVRESAPAYNDQISYDSESCSNELVHIFQGSTDYNQVDETETAYAMSTVPQKSISYDNLEALIKDGCNIRAVVSQAQGGGAFIDAYDCEFVGIGMGQFQCKNSGYEAFSQASFEKGFYLNFSDYSVDYLPLDFELIGAVEVSLFSK